MTPYHKKLLIATGPTGGHFFPAVSFAEAYQKTYPEAEIWFLLGKKKVAFDATPYLKKFRFHFISSQPLPRGFTFKWFLFLFQLIKSFIVTIFFIGRLKPTVLVSFGSYSTFVSVVVVWIYRIPIIVHEQNRVFGWTNWASSFFARWVAISFPETLGSVSQHKIKYVGYPIRSEMRTRDEASVQRTKEPYHILVLGGSQGSQILNQTIFDFFSLLTSEEKKKIAVIHITGQKDFAVAQTSYSNSEVEHQVYAFSNEIKKHYEASDLVVARAGAGTIFELAVFGLPAILIPYPFAYAHQAKNAKYLEEKGAVFVLEEEGLTDLYFKKVIFDLLWDENRRRMMGESVKQLDVHDADLRLVQLVNATWLGKQQSIP